MNKRLLAVVFTVLFSPLLVEAQHGYGDAQGASNQQVIGKLEHSSVVASTPKENAQLRASTDKGEKELSLNNGPSEHVSLQVFPNPFVDRISVTLSSGNMDQVRISDMIGNRVETINLDEAAGKMSIELLGYPAGIYFVSPVYKNTVLTTKRIVKR